MYFNLGDVINTVLTIYMMAGNQPLPQSDEVLMCNTETTLDEVKIVTSDISKLSNPQKLLRSAAFE